MKVFISWSGELSKQIARPITEWPPSALQKVKPWFSEEIEKGANWQNELSSQLKDTKFSIIILTSEALKSDGLCSRLGLPRMQLEELMLVLFYLELNRQT